ncbi:MAG: hypothetical protein SWC96_04805 [Thermodesulfobacteriota bacterium]|nr:hypothetical protein [Thermodesulfobacteriota bacterium]
MSILFSKNGPEQTLRLASAAKPTRKISGYPLQPPERVESGNAHGLICQTSFATIHRGTVLPVSAPCKSHFSPALSLFYDKNQIIIKNRLKTEKFFLTSSARIIKPVLVLPTLLVG